MTKTWICIFAGAAALLAADKPAPRKTGKAATSAAARPATLTLPPGAVETKPGTWTYTGPDGRKWIYQKTPFALVRFEEKAEAAGAAAASEKELAVLKATEDGDSVRFERPSPFGVQKWTRKKSELNDLERQAWERTSAGASASAPKQE